MDEEKIRELIRDELNNFIFTDRYVFDKNIQILDGRKIQVGKTTGLKIGTEVDQKIGFFNATPVVQQASISAPTITGSDNDSVARAAIGSIITALRNLGLIA